MVAKIKTTNLTNKILNLNVNLNIVCKKGSTMPLVTNKGSIIPLVAKIGSTMSLITRKGQSYYWLQQKGQPCLWPYFMKGLALHQSQNLNIKRCVTHFRSKPMKSDVPSKNEKHRHFLTFGEQDSRSAKLGSHSNYLFGKKGLAYKGLDEKACKCQSNCWFCIKQG